MQSGNSTTKKSTNMRLILGMLVTNQHVHRTDITQRTNVTKQTISNLVDELEALGFVQKQGVKKQGIQKPGVGKPSERLCLNPNRAYTIGIHVRQQGIKIGLYNLHNTQIDRMYQPLSKLNETTLPGLLHELCDTILASASVAKEVVLGIGLVLPTPYRFSTHWDYAPAVTLYQDIKSQLMQKTGLPVVSETLSSAIASHENLFGRAKQLNNYIYVYLGNTIDAAFVQNRKLQSRLNTISGQLGHTIVHINGRSCPCGNDGCLNQYASLEALHTHIARKTRQRVAIQDIGYGDGRYKDAIEEWLSDMSEPMRIALNTLENLFNPETVILGGDAPDWFLEQFITNLRPFLPSVSQLDARSVPRLIRTERQNHMEIKGAATLPLYHILTQEMASSTEHCPIAVINSIFDIKV